MDAVTFRVFLCIDSPQIWKKIDLWVWVEGF